MKNYLNTKIKMEIQAKKILSNMTGFKNILKFNLHKSFDEKYMFFLFIKHC